jgi:hypothetical protein
MTELNKTNSIEQIDSHIESILNSNTSSEWLKWALRSGCHRDPIGVATDAEQLFVILQHRLDVILHESKTPIETVPFIELHLAPEYLEHA